MIKKIEIVSLSSGILGEEVVRHELELGLKRLKEYDVEVKFSKYALSGLEYIKSHPEKRAEDLLEAFADDSVDMILCAIGGDDTYRLLPYLFDNDELKNAIREKIFLGFSDTTMNHFMLNKLGLNTFYGQAFLPDVCELSDEMLPYTKKYFEELLRTGKIAEIAPSDYWYEERTKWEPDQIGVSMPKHKNQGFELLRGSPKFEGKILGGCIDSIFDIFDTGRYPDTAALCSKYELFPSAEEWKGHILLLETSEEKPTPELFKAMLLKLKDAGVFEAVNGVLFGKPQNEVNFEEYKKLLIEVIDNEHLPIVVNINIGHATPRCIIPFGVNAVVDVEKQKISFDYTDKKQIKMKR